MPDIFNALFQATKRVEAKKDEAYAQEIQSLLMQLAKSEHEKSDYNMLVRDLRNGSKLLKDIQIMEDGTIRFLASAVVDDLQDGDIVDEEDASAT
jgi:hypothetical protein